MGTGVDRVGEVEAEDLGVEGELGLEGPLEVVGLAEPVTLALEHDQRDGQPLARSASAMSVAWLGGTALSSVPWNRIIGLLSRSR